MFVPCKFVLLILMIIVRKLM